MSLIFRYGAALVLVALYYVQSWIPLLSVSRQAGSSADPLLGLSFLQASSGYDYHYLTIGIMPFVLGGLVAQLCRWQLPQLYVLWSRNDPSAERIGRVSAYAIGAVMAFSVTVAMPAERFEWAPWLTFAELMLSVTTVDQLLRLLKPLEIVSSPPMLFLGINVCSAVVYGYGTLPYSTFDVQSWWWLFASVVLAALTIVASVAGYFWHTVVTAKAATPYGMLQRRIRFKVLRAGVTPVIYATYLCYLPLSLLVASPSTWVVTQMWPVAALASVIFLLTLPLIRLSLQVDDLRDYLYERGVMFFLKDSEYTGAPSDILAMLVSSHARMSTLFFVMLIVTEGVWMSIAPEPLKMYGVVGGISWFLLWSVVTDMHHCWKQIKGVYHG